MKTLYTKLFAIQTKGVQVSKDWVNPHFKSKYMTLDNIIETLSPLLAENKILVTHFVKEQELITRVADVESWEELDSSFWLLATDPQKKGSEITYAKRYNLSALFNICADEDDDANSVSGSNYTPRSNETTSQGIKTPKLLAEYIAEIKQEKDSNVIRTLQDEAKQGRLTEKQIAWLDSTVQDRLQAL